MIHPTFGPPEIVCPFHAADGALLGYEVRWKGKKIRPVGIDGELGNWWENLPGGLRPLFNIPGILAHPDRTIIVCEGPKAMFAAARLFPTAIATCWPGGVNARGQVDFSPLERRTVIWWADADPQGYECMDDIFLAHAPVHTPWFVLPPEDAEKGWDAADLIPPPDDPPAWLRARLLKHAEWGARVEPIVTAYRREAEEKRAQAAAHREEKRRDKKSPAPEIMADTARTEIQIIGGQLPRIVDEAEQVFLDSPHSRHIYQRGGILVEFSRLPAASVLHGVKRDAGSPILLPVSPARMRELFTRAVNFTKWDARMDDTKPIDCPADVAATYLSRASWGARPLSGLAEGPTLRPDGSILQGEGYDPTTGLLVSFGGQTFPEIPESPTMQDAEECLDRILTLIWDFPFVQGAHRSAAISAILTGAIRRSLPSAPLVPISATAPATGKSLLTDVISIILTGRSAPAMPQGDSEEEDRKRLLASLLSGDMILNIDNVTRPLEGDAFCSILTQEFFRDRVLGESRNATLPTDVLMLANGNNIMVKGDLSSRCIMVMMDARVEHPESREFAGDLRDIVREQRPRLLADALTILRAYHVASASGERPAKLLPWGRFEAWSRWVREALVWLGQPDPLDTAAELSQADPVRQSIGGLLEILAHRYVSEFTVRQVIMDAGTDADLMSAVAEVAGERGGKISARLLAWTLRKFTRRVFEGHWVEQVGKYGNQSKWAVLSNENNHIQHNNESGF